MAKDKKEDAAEVAAVPENTTDYFAARVAALEKELGVEPGSKTLEELGLA